MANSTITLYKKTTNWKLLPQNLFMLDDIGAYLSAVPSADKIVLNDMQYIKNQLEIEIKIDMSQTNANPITNFAYVEVTNYGEGRSYYYYIKEVEWRAYSTCKFVLVMDVLNSIKYGTDYTLSPKTKINRQHKNRLVKVGDNSIKTFIKFDVGYPTDDPEDYNGTKIKIYVDDVAETFEVILLDALYFGSEGANQIYEFKIEYNERLGDVLLDLYYVEITVAGVDGDELLGEGTVSGTTINTIKYYRKIDLLSENIPCGQYHDLDSDTLITNPFNDSDWYLIYATDNVPTTTDLNNPLRCYLCTNKSLMITPNQPAVQGRIYPEMLETSRYYYYRFEENSPTIPPMHMADGTMTEELSGIGIHSYVLFYKAGDKIIVTVVSQNQDYAISYGPTDFLTITADCVCAYKNSFHRIPTVQSVPASPTQTFYFADYPQFTLKTIDDIDRTDSKIVKIIKLPYAPYNFTYSNDILIIPDEWELGSFQSKNLLKLKDLNTKFNYDFDSSVNNINRLLILYSAPDYTSLRNDIWESKIYHSDYYMPKVVYDSFAFGFNMEKVDLKYVHEHRTDSKMKLTFTCTTTINSRFMLQFPQYKCASLGTQDYNSVMPIIRNNEIALYNVPYINYIRTGYNYDVKTKNRQTAVNAMTFTLGLASTLAALAMPTSALTVPLVIGMGASTVKSLVSTISSASQSEQNIQQKLQEAQAQGASVAGSDDVDLMSEYTSNRASLMTYKTSDVMRDLLLDLFYYTGYADNTMGVPNLNTRKWFNFVACDAIITLVDGHNVNVSDEIQRELIGIWKSGVTVLHKVDGGYDMDQVKENAEVSIEDL